MVFIETPIFTADVYALLSDEEYAALQQHLVAMPNAGAIIAGTRRLAEDSVVGCGKGQTWRDSCDLLPRRRASSDSDDSDLPKRNQRRPDAQREDGIAEN
jgi:hypothetical protein